MRMRGIAAAFVLAIPVRAQQPEQTSRFDWSEQIDAGRVVRIRNINGTITVRSSGTDRVELVAMKRWRRGDPSIVRIHAQKYGTDIYICPLYGAMRVCGDSYNSDDDRHDGRRNDVKVELVVLVPNGVHVTAATVNGDVSVAEVTDDIDAGTVNGNVSVESGRGALKASTMNGEVVARVPTAARAMEFSSMNGNVFVELASSVAADVDMSTLNGEARSSFGLSPAGRYDRRRLTGHVGPAGGPALKLTTMNGNVELKKM